VVKQDMYTEYGLYRSLKYMCMEVQDICKYIKMDFVEKSFEEANFCAITLNYYICVVLIGCMNGGYMTSSHKYCVYTRWFKYDRD